MTEPLLRMEHITKRFPGVLALDRCVAGNPARRDPWPAGRERRRQIHFAENPVRRLSAGFRHDHARRQAARSEDSAGCPEAGHHHDLSGIQPDPDHDGRGEHVSRPRARSPRKRAGRFRLLSKMREETEKVLRHLSIDLDPMALVSDLSVGEQQMVEIARALSRDSRIIVMDEPTAGPDRARGRSPLPHHHRSQIAPASASSTSTHRLHEVEQIATA